MIRSLVWIAAFAGGSTATVSPDTNARYMQKISLPSNQTAVVAEGDLEARSIGSYSVRLYASDAAQAADDTTFYQSGILLERDGSIEDVRLADIDGDGRDEIVVIIRSVGSGGYLSAQSLSFANNCIEARTKVTNLPKDADPIAALETSYRNNRVIGKGVFHDPNGGAR
jgi:hypothetical protein